MIYVIIIFTLTYFNEEATGCINKEVLDAISEPAIGAIIVPTNPLSCFFISCFTVSLAPSIDLIFLVTLQF